MKNKRQKAILNNNDLYKEIFRSQNIESNCTDSIWYCLDKTPPLYSNLVTISEEWKPDDIFRNIDRKYEDEKWEGWSLKDSFGLLDLTAYGFAKLFDAQWVYLEATNFKPESESRNLRYEIIKNEPDLAKWRLAWDSDERLGEQIFSSKLLDNPRVYFVAGYYGKQIVSGCFANETENVLGISNFFSPGNDSGHWSEMISFIFDSIYRADIVGYKRKEIINKLRELGFEPVGNLTVWLKKRDL
jgi:hypothetical protein